MRKPSIPAILLSNVIHEQGISQNNLISDAGIDRSTYYQMLNGKRLGHWTSLPRSSPGLI